MLTRSKQNNTILAWEPFATSTPLRLIPGKTKNDGLPQKVFRKGKDVKALLLKETFKTVNNGQSKQLPEQNNQIPKKIKRNRSKCYFDISSSSEDEDSCLNSNGPTIKISLESGTNKKSNSKNGDLKKKRLKSPKNNIIKANKIVVDNAVKAKSAKNKATRNSKPDGKVTSTSQKLDSEIKLPHKSENSSKDYDGKHKANVSNEKKNTSQDKSNNSCKDSKKPKDELVDLNGCESASHKQKRTKPITNADPIEKKRFKTAERRSPENKSPKEPIKPKPKVKSMRKDSSHQLFSDSMHQELINSLDLTTAEPDNLDEVFKSPLKMTPNKILPKKRILKAKVKSINLSLKRSGRLRQRPKEFWMPGNQSDLNEVTDGSKEEHKNGGKGDAVNGFQYPYFNDLQNDKDHVLKREKGNAESTKGIMKNVKTKSNTKKLGFTQSSPNKNSEKYENQVQDTDNKENNAKVDKDNLKKSSSLPINFPGFIKQLPAFEDCVDGVQASEYWSLKNFKGGVLRVDKECQISDRTKFKNSYFGGILIKGSLKMTIGSKDLVVNQGDMAFVPPLTEWCVIGNHENESLFYYWCLRLRS